MSLRLAANTSAVSTCTGMTKHAKWLMCQACVRPSKTELRVSACVCVCVCVCANASAVSTCTGMIQSARPQHNITRWHGMTKHTKMGNAKSSCLVSRVSLCACVSVCVRVCVCVFVCVCLTSNHLTPAGRLRRHARVSIPAPSCTTYTHTHTHTHTHMVLTLCSLRAKCTGALYTGVCILRHVLTTHACMHTCVHRAFFAALPVAFSPLVRQRGVPPVVYRMPSSNTK